MEICLHNNNKNLLYINKYDDKNLVDNNNKIWFIYNNLSCRYDSFFFIYSNIIYYIIKNYNNKTENIKCFDNISEYLIKSNLLEKKEGFWSLIEKNNLDTIGILNTINNPKNFDSIGSVYKFLKNCDIFCIKYKLKRICNLCSYKIEKEEFYNSYISFNNDDLTKFNKIEDKLIDLFLMDDC